MIDQIRDRKKELELLYLDLQNEIRYLHQVCYNDIYVVLYFCDINQVISDQCGGYVLDIIVISKRYHKFRR